MLPLRIGRVLGSQQGLGGWPTKIFADAKEKLDRSMAKPSLLDRILAASASRDGYFTASEVREADFSDADLHRLVGRGDVERVKRGVYRLTRFPSSPHGDLWEAVLWAQPAVISHLTALRLHDLTSERPGVVDITVPSDGRLRKEIPAGYRLHAADVAAADRTIVAGIPVTSVRRTVLDLFVDGEVPRTLLLEVTANAVTRGLLGAEEGEQLRALLAAEPMLLRQVLKLQAEHQRSQRNARRTPHLLQVKTIADRRLTVIAPGGSGDVPFFSSLPIDAPQPGVRHALIMLHGALRDADAYFQLGGHTLAHADAERTLLIVPQFLAEQDINGHDLGPETLRWATWQWMSGGRAIAPDAISSFSVLDTLLTALLDRVRFPVLTEIVIAGHSAGALFAQRYAVVGAAHAAVEARGITLRYVLANATSYVYFDDMRPLDDGSFALFDHQRCPEFNTWEHGLEQLPPYAVAMDPASLEARYVARDVTYLLGSLDVEPSHTVLDRSCASLAQGPHRFARGRAYADYLRRRHGEALAHRCIIVPGVGHDSNGIFTSEPGIAALFGSSE